MAKIFAPEFATPTDNHNEAERIKRASDGIRGNLYEELRAKRPEIDGEAEQLAKSYGIYLEYNRALSGKEKDWFYMIRIGLPGGGPVSPAQWRLLDELADHHGVNPEGHASLRLTTRQAVQLHWVDKQGVLEIVRRTAESGMLSLNACGDNVRNVMACPLPHTPESDQVTAELGRWFALPTAPFVQIFAIDPVNLDTPRGPGFHYGPQLLNRKFKIAVSDVHRDPETGQLIGDNCVEVRTHDLGIVPVIDGDRITAWQVYAGGGQGERNGKITGSMLSQPLALVGREGLLPLVDAVVSVHRDWGDRKNRHWARLKYLVRAKGIDWLCARVAERLGHEPERPIADLDPGPRMLHHGWQGNSYGAFIENGRLIDNSPNGRLKTMVRELSTKYETPLRVTPNQDILFTELSAEAREAFEADLADHGFGTRRGKPYSRLRTLSGACVGRDTCRLAYTDSEKFEPELIDTLEDMGWGELAASIGITGCERQCFRPATKTIGLVGSGLNRYMLKLLGTEDGRHQGLPLADDEGVYLRGIPREQVAGVLDTLFRFYEVNRDRNESLGYFLRRIGRGEIISYLETHPETSALMARRARDLSLPVS